MGAVISEIRASNAGIGYLMISASSSLQVPLVYAGLMTIAAIGILFYAIFAPLETRFTSWGYRKSPCKLLIVKTLLIDYGSGNLHSAYKALEVAGFNSAPHRLILSNRPEDALDADALILPGQGHFRQVMEAFTASGFEQVLRNHIASGKAFLGICVGMQILFEGSEESELAGLGILPGYLKRFPKGLPVPQMQWNRLKQIGQCPLLEGLDQTSFAYFVHSYYLPKDLAQNGAISEYGLEFLSVISQNNIHATQFHPEKSQQVGLKMLENFRQWAEKSVAQLA
ncbi:MAG: imidazole glycerol phosphate synthase subunit HisH [Deinococcales bacterium]